jgi:hypothetical protein
MTTTESVKRGRVLAKLKSNVRHAAYFITSMETFKAEQSSDAPRGPTTLKDHCKSVLKKLKQPGTFVLNCNMLRLRHRPAPEDSTKTSTRTSAITSARTSVSSIEDPEPIVFASSRVSRVPTLNALSLADEAPLTMDTTDVKDKSGFGSPVREPIKTRATVVSPIQAQSGFRPSSVNRRFSSDPTQRFHQIAQQLKTHTSSLDLGKMGNDSGSLSSDGVSLSFPIEFLCGDLAYTNIELCKAR